MHSRTFMFRRDAEDYALEEGDRLEAHAIIGRHRLSGIWHVSLVKA